MAREPPETARASLQNSVCQLRKVLGAEVLLTGVDGYRVNVQPEQIDIVVFWPGRGCGGCRSDCAISRCKTA